MAICAAAFSNGCFSLSSLRTANAVNALKQSEDWCRTSGVRQPPLRASTDAGSLQNHLKRNRAACSKYDNLLVLQGSQHCSLIPVSVIQSSPKDVQRNGRPVMAAAREGGASTTGADYESELQEIATKAAVEAGLLITAASGKAQNVETKGVRSDLVTEVDKACEDLIKQRIQASFPSHAILGEETSTTEELDRLDASLADSEWTWIVDPIDGTLNFVGGMPLSVVSIGIAKANRMQVGVVYNPYSGELFTARRGKGSYLNGERIHVLPPDTELEDGAVSVGFPSKRPVRERMLRGVSAVAPHARTIRALGTAALHISYVAAGKLACFFELNLKPWDVAAAWLIVEEAGGHVTDMAGKPMRLRAGPILASCGGQLHARVLSLLKEAECTGEEADLQ